MEITERIKTFEDACHELGEDHPFVKQWNYVSKCADSESIHDLYAYMKLRIITAALNEGWQPKFTEDEERWYPWHLLWTEEELRDKNDEWKQRHALKTTGGYTAEYAGFASALSRNAPSDASALFGSRLCYKSEALADYSGRQFADLWADFYLIRK